MDKINYRQEFSWSTASRVCFSFGGDLVSVANKREMDFVYNLSSNITDNPAWIGLVYRFQKGEYLWSNGESFNESFPVKWLDNRSSTAIVLLSSFLQLTPKLLRVLIGSLLKSFLLLEWYA